MIDTMERTYMLTKRKWWLMSLSFIICHLSFSPAEAQTFTQRLQTVNGKEGRMTITHSADIDKLVNGPHAKPVAPVTTPATTTATATPASGNSTAAARVPVTSTASRPTTTERTEPVRDTVDIILSDQPRKKVMRNSYKINGYRVQAFAGGNQRKDKQKAEQVGNDIKQHFPDEPVYTHFYSPRWICRVGNYRTYEEAHEMLLNIRKLGYTSATIVKGKITVQY